MTNETIRADALSEQIKDSLEQELTRTGQQAAADVTYLNVMQELVEDKADKYMQINGVCPCPRCRIDVIALTLSKLPSKYVVVHRDDAIPMLTVYENRYSTNLISTLIAACEQVKAHPRHGQSGEEAPRGVAFVR